MLSKKHIRSWSFMELSVTEIVKIIKSENNVIAREKALMCCFFDLIRELMKLALEEVDAGLVEETKKQGYQIEKKNKLVFPTSLFFNAAVI